METPTDCPSEDNSGKSCRKVTLTIRLIRSFQFKNWKPLVIRNCDLTMSWEQFKLVVDQEILACGSLPIVFKRDVKYYDGFKLETDPMANRAKSANALINLSTPLIDLNEHSSSKLSTLASHNVRNEYEISLFNLKDYEEYVQGIVKEES